MQARSSGRCACALLSVGSANASLAEKDHVATAFYHAEAFVSDEIGAFVNRHQFR